MNTIGNKVRKIRELKNLKQEQMADSLGISVTSYGKIERDETDVSVERLEQIAKILGLNVQDILSFDEGVIFNFLNTASGCGYMVTNNGALVDNERKLYEDKIKLLEDKINYLSEEVQRLKK